MCSKLCAKLILIVTNFILFVAGGVLFGFGIAALVNPNDLQKFISKISNTHSVSEVIDFPSLVTDNAKFMIVVGAIIFVFSFLGCAGAMCEVKWMLFLYWISIVILIILEVALIIFAVVKPGLMKDQTTTFMKNKWKSYSPENFYTNGTLRMPSDAVSFAWVVMQFKFGCCGIFNYSDYESLAWTDREYDIDGDKIQAVVPPSCCVLKDRDIPVSTLPADYRAHLKECLRGDATYINRLGCYDSVEEIIKKNNHITIIVCSVVILVELLAIACAVYLWKYTDTGKM